MVLGNPGGAHAAAKKKGEVMETVIKLRLSGDAPAELLIDRQGGLWLSGASGNKKTTPKKALEWFHESYKFADGFDGDPTILTGLALGHLGSV